MTQHERKIRVLRSGDPEHGDDLTGLTPTERLELVWTLTVEAWKFRGEDIRERPLQRGIRVPGIGREDLIKNKTALHSGAEPAP